MKKILLIKPVGMSNSSTQIISATVQNQLKLNNRPIMLFMLPITILSVFKLAIFRMKGSLSSCSTFCKISQFQMMRLRESEQISLMTDVSTLWFAIKLTLLMKVPKMQLQKLYTISAKVKYSIRSIVLTTDSLIKLTSDLLLYQTSEPM